MLRLAEVPGYGVDSAQQVIAEVGPAAATFPSPEQLSSWVGTCPGREESAEVSKNNRSPKGNRMMRRVLNQVAHAAVKTKGSVFQALYRRFVIRLGHNKAIWAIDPSPLQANPAFESSANLEDSASRRPVH